MESTFQPTEEYIKSNELLKQSTTFKKTDIHKAIELINEAISLYPSDDSVFKLSSYYFEAGNIQSSYDVLNKLLDKYSYSGFHDMKNMNRSKIYEKIAIINSKDKKYQDYIKNSSLQFFNWLVGLSVQGRKKEVVGLITRTPFEMYFIETKMNKAFRELNLADKQQEFYSALQKHFANFMDKLVNLCGIYHKHDNGSMDLDNVDLSKSFGEIIDDKLGKDSSFVDIYNTLDEKMVVDLINSRLNAH